MHRRLLLTAWGWSPPASGWVSARTNEDEEGTLVSATQALRSPHTSLRDSPFLFSFTQQKQVLMNK